MAATDPVGSMASGPVDAWRTALLESSLDCVIVMDGAGILVDVNAGTERTFGFERTAIIGRRLGDVFVPPELREAHEGGLARYLHTGESNILGRRIEVQALHADGRRIAIELSIVRLRGIEPPLFVGHLRTIEKQQRWERRLRASAAASDVLARSATASDAIGGVLEAIGTQLEWAAVHYWTVGPAGTSIDLTSSWCAPDIDATSHQSPNVLPSGTGVPATAWQTGRPLWVEDIRQAPNLPGAHGLVSAGLLSAVGIPVHVRGHVVAVIEAFAGEPQSEDKELVALLDAIASQLGHLIEELAAGEKLSRTEAKLIAALGREQEARRAAEEAIRARDQFLAVVSHELRTPLGPILGWARMLTSMAVTPEVLASALAAIERNAALQARLVDDLLDMSRSVAGKLTLDSTSVDLVHVIEAALETHRGAALAKGVGLDFERDGEPPAIRGDASRLQQVVSNLAGNAIKFTPAGGRVRLSLRHSADVIELAVIDTGAGIDARFLPQVFEPFRQAEANTGGEGGLGLGLAIVRDLVRRHGGEVHAASPGPGSGATFTVRLPIGGPSQDPSG